MTSPVVFEDGRYNGRTLREWLPELVTALAEGTDAMRIVLFGSVADGTDDRDSDVDILVVLPRVDDKIETIVALRQAAKDIPVPMDLIPTDPEEIAERGNLPGSILGPALREGEVLFERAS